MDRRDFFKKILSASLLTPLLLSSKTTENELELYLIADNPQDQISTLLKELTRYASIPEKSFSFLSPHPQKDALSKILTAEGWSQENNIYRAFMALSYSPLQSKARPSFTLVKEGKVIDIRPERLQALWKGMDHPRSFSAGLTTVSFRSSRMPLLQGKHVVVYKDGSRAAVLALNKDRRQTFRTRSGLVTVAITGGKALVENSSCRNKICLHSQPVSLAGERIICAPNHFLIAVTGKGMGAVDTTIG